MTNDFADIDLSILESAINLEDADRADGCAKCSLGNPCALHSENTSPSAQLTIRDIMMSAGMDIGSFAEGLGACASCLEDTGDNSVRLGESQYCCNGCALTGKCICSTSNNVSETASALDEILEIEDTSFAAEVADSISQTSVEANDALTAVQLPLPKAIEAPHQTEPVSEDVAIIRTIEIEAITPKQNRYWKYEIDGRYDEARVLAANRFWYTVQ